MWADDARYIPHLFTYCYYLHCSTQLEGNGHQIAVSVKYLWSKYTAQEMLELIGWVTDDARLLLKLMGKLERTLWLWVEVEVWLTST